MIFKAIKEWFFPKEYLSPKKTLKELIEYLPVGDLAILAAWVKYNLPYRRDLDEQGNFDKAQDYNGADLTLMLGFGDCESKGAVYAEVIRAWKGWDSGHTYFRFTNKFGEVKAHDICWFITPNGQRGWMEEVPYFGSTKELIEFYAGIGWKIDGMYQVNDIGERLA